jgi:hypothetical protein
MLINIKGVKGILGNSGINITVAFYLGKIAGAA